MRKIVEMKSPRQKRFDDSAANFLPILSPNLLHLPNLPYQNATISYG